MLHSEQQCWNGPSLLPLTKSTKFLFGALELQLLGGIFKFFIPLRQKQPIAVIEKKKSQAIFGNSLSAENKANMRSKNKKLTFVAIAGIVANEHVCCPGTIETIGSKERQAVSECMTRPC